MKRTGLIVADGRRARFFAVVREDGLRNTVRLDEHATLTNIEAKAAATRAKTERNTHHQAGPVHPVGARRAKHQLEDERRFGSQIVKHAIELTAGWDGGTLVLIAEPRLLGLIRVELRQALQSSIRLEELARDYSGLSKSELETLVARDRLMQ